MWTVTEALHPHTDVCFFFLFVKMCMLNMSSDFVWYNWRNLFFPVFLLNIAVASSPLKDYRLLKPQHHLLAVLFFCWCIAGLWYYHQQQLISWSIAWNHLFCGNCTSAKTQTQIREGNVYIAGECTQFSATLCGPAWQRSWYLSGGQFLNTHKVLLDQRIFFTVHRTAGGSTPFCMCLRCGNTQWS